MKAITSMPPGHYLGALEMYLEEEIYNFLIRVPFTKEKLHWCPCPFKNEAYIGGGGQA